LSFRARLAIVCLIFGGLAGAHAAFASGGVIDPFNRADENPVSDGGKWANDILGNGEKPLKVVSNQLAAGVRGGDRVGLFIAKSLESLIGIYGIRLDRGSQGRHAVAPQRAGVRRLGG